MGLAFDEAVRRQSAAVQAQKVRTSLVIHAQTGQCWYGLAGLGYQQQRGLPGSRERINQLVSGPFMNVTTSESFSLDRNLMGQINSTSKPAYQRFIQKDAEEFWNVVISQIVSPRRPPGPPAPPFTLAISVHRDSRQPWSVGLSESDGFLHGIGPSPMGTGLARYSVVLEDVEVIPA